MRSWVLAAGLLAAAAATGAQAADLDDGPPPRSLRLGLRRSALRRHLQVPGAAAAPTRRPRRGATEPLRRAADPARARLSRGRRRLRAQVPAGPAALFLRRAAPRLRRPLRAARAGQGAAAAQGWHDFHDGDVRGDIATVRARRPSGRLFDLAIDRCSGEIVSAQPLEPRRIGPYAAGTLRLRARRRAAGTGPTEAAAASRIARGPRRKPGPSRFSTAATLARRA